jgi:small subunit ribosomal protein S4e
VLRDLRRVAGSAREARELLRAGHVRVDGKVAKDPARGIGLMDTVSLGPPLNEHFRLLKDRRGKLILVAIPQTEAEVKIGRIRFKHTVRKGKVEVTLHDGRNLLAPSAGAWKVGDSLKLKVPEQQVLSHLKLAPGQLAFVAGGSHVGQVARVERVEVRNSPQPNRVHFKEGFATNKEYVYVIGEQVAQIQLPEGVSR